MNEQMKSAATQSAAKAKLDELSLREQLRDLRTQIPDQPGLNPIVNVAFDISAPP